MVLTESASEVLRCDHSTETASAVLLHRMYSITIWSVDLTFESGNEILRCKHSNETPLGPQLIAVPKASEWATLIRINKDLSQQ